MIDRHSAVIIFARVPRAGHVKTRLAAGIGDAAALSAYLTLAGLVIRRVVASPTYTVRVAYTPESGERAMRDWLGASVTLVPQADGDLGARMAAAIDGALRTGARASRTLQPECRGPPILGVPARFT